MLQIGNIKQLFTKLFLIYDNIKMEIFKIEKRLAVIKSLYLIK